MEGLCPRSESLASTYLFPPSRAAPGIQPYAFHSPLPSDSVWIQSLCPRPLLCTCPWTLCFAGLLVFTPPLHTVVWPLFPAACQLYWVYLSIKALVRFNFFLNLRSVGWMSGALSSSLYPKLATQHRQDLYTFVPRFPHMTKELAFDIYITSWYSNSTRISAFPEWLPLRYCGEGVS